MRLLKKNIYIAAILLSVMVVASSCTKNFSEINTNPTAVTSMNTKYLLPNTELHIAGTRYETWRMDLIYLDEWSQQLAGTGWGADRYQYSDSYSSAYWNTAYDNYVKPLQNIIHILRADSAANTNKLAVAKIWRAFVFQRITDVWGDVPYTQAGKGLWTHDYKPTFNTQKSIYMSIINQLEEANKMFNPNQPTYGKADLMFQGDITKWKKFDNSLLMNAGLRLSKVDPTLAEKVVKKAYQNGVMTSNNDIAYIAHPGGPDGINKSGIGQVFQDFGVTGHDFRCSNTLINRLVKFHDPRLFIYSGVYTDKGQNVTPSKPDSMMGLRNGLTSADLTNLNTYKYAQPNRDIMVTYSAPTIFVSYAEVCFDEAEAAHRGWIQGSADTYYNNGIQAAMKQLTLYNSTKAVISDNAISSYEQDPYVDLNSTSTYDSNPKDPVLDKIITQKWLACFLNGYEAYDNWRRTGYPMLTPGASQGQTNGQIPRRVRYPEELQTLNQTNYQQAVSDLNGGDLMTSRVWWDVKK
ncbi:MAG TPA: SusD/RagB family nutrient-binding outer membrane lipoprotein [Balneolales bacterium]|nr:SusD/RagB family nutrient-binding outer membrane lipoprotein [Balneolales bacterium]